MARFKVGDRIRCLTKSYPRYVTLGKIYTVLAAPEEYSYKINDGRAGFWGLYSSEWELVVDDFKDVVDDPKKLFAYLKRELEDGQAHTS